MIPSSTPSIDFLQSLARQAGEILRDGFGQDFRVFHKGEIDLVTDVDRRSESFLVNEIRRRFPDHSIIAEEGSHPLARDDRIAEQSVFTAGVSPSREISRQWYIDPLDGTINFAHCVPIFSVSLAYAEEGETRLGAVYDPLRDELFYAERGRGAWLNGQPINASHTSVLNESLLVTGFPYDIRDNPDNNLNLYARFALLTQGVRRLGSAALDLSYVACGRFDGFWELQLSPWDMAAGTLIAMEAGATVTTVLGETNLLVPPYSVLAANSIIYAQMLSVIKGE